MFMRWSLRRRRSRFGGSSIVVVPVIHQVAEDAVDNGLIGVYYGTKNLEIGGYLQEVTLVFKDEHLRKHGYLDRIYRLIRRILYGRIVDIETFYIHVSTNADTAEGGGRVDYCLFPKIYSGDNGIYADNIHLDTQTPCPKRLVETWAVDALHENVPLYNLPHIYVNTSNHAMATHDANPALQKTVYRPSTARKWKRRNTEVSMKFLTRTQVEKKYKTNKNKNNVKK